MNSIFDEAGILNIQDMVANHPSFKIIMKDGVVTEDELKLQAESALKALRRVEKMCNEEQQSVFIDALAEMSVLFITYHIHQLQNIEL